MSKMQTSAWSTKAETCLYLSIMIKSYHHISDFSWSKPKCYIMKEDPEIEWPSQMSWKSKKYHNIIVRR